MYRSRLAARQHIRSLHYTTRRLHAAPKAVIDIRDATFYRRYPSDTDSAGSNPALFEKLNFALPNTKETSTDPQYWSVISPSSLARTTFLQVLAGQHICIPPTARSYPYLSTVSESPQHAIKYVGFDAERGSSVGGTSVRGAYLSARYESRREETDFSVHDYLIGHTELNALQRDLTTGELSTLEEIVEQLNLRKLLSMPVANLSNGQTRRARIAKALMARPEVLLLDGPFMGLDPNTLATMSNVLQRLAVRQSPRLIMSLRPEDGIPEWVNHLVIVSDALQVLAQGHKDEILQRSYQDKTNGMTKSILDSAQQGHNVTSAVKLSRDGFPKVSPSPPAGEPLVEMSGVRVAYGDKVVLGDWSQSLSNEQRPGLWWNLRRGQRCGIFGPNGSGKTTMLSLITSDHPQTYSLPIKLFGRSRLPGPGEPGISLFDIQKRMGHSSPEVHAFFPKGLTVRRALQSAWADAPMAKPKLTEDAKERVDACLRWFAKELHPTSQDDGQSGAPSLDWADDKRFAELSFSNQRLVLFLRAVVGNPDLVILDEALSGIDEATRDKALLFLSHGETIEAVVDGQARKSGILKLTFGGLSNDQALLVISHSREDVPGCLREWICLPEPGEGRQPRTGTLPGPLELNPGCWQEIWGR
jgi:ABC-type molybdenum transport system ATPase subunit/photorepair protein PhrA